MKSVSCPNTECPLSKEAGTGSIIRYGFYHTNSGKRSIQVPKLWEDVLLERRNALPSAPTPSRNVRRSYRDERRRPEQVCDRPSKEDRLEYRRSMARKGSLCLSSVQRPKNSCARHRGASGRRDSDDRR